MGAKSLLARLKLVLTSYQNDVAQIGAWCIRRVKFLFCVVAALIILHLIQQIFLTAGANRFSAAQTTLPAWKKDEIIGESLPSLPYVTWKANKNNRRNLKCGQYPNIYDLSFFNTYWQTSKLQNYTVRIFGKKINQISAVGQSF
jgi:hypothetical protein